MIVDPLRASMLQSKIVVPLLSHLKAAHGRLIGDSAGAAGQKPSGSRQGPRPHGNDGNYGDALLFIRIYIYRLFCCFFVLARPLPWAGLMRRYMRLNSVCGCAFSGNGRLMRCCCWSVAKAGY